MQQVAYYNRFDINDVLIKSEPYPVDVQSGDRVVFVDNSFIGDCATNNAPNRINIAPAGWGNGRYIQIRGTVIRTDSVQTAIYNEYINCHHREIDMPIVVSGDDGSIIYCHPINIRKI